MNVLTYFGVKLDSVAVLVRAGNSVLVRVYLMVGVDVSHMEDTVRLGLSKEVHVKQNNNSEL